MRQRFNVIPRKVDCSFKTRQKTKGTLANMPDKELRFGQISQKLGGIIWKMWKMLLKRGKIFGNGENLEIRNPNSKFHISLIK